jgi:hypothetical protein
MDGNEKPQTPDQHHQQQQGLFLTVYPKGEQPWSSGKGNRLMTERLRV